MPGVPFGTVDGVCRGEVARPVRVRDGDHDHLRNHVGPVDAGAEDLEEAGHRVEMRVAVEEVHHGIGARQVD